MRLSMRRFVAVVALAMACGTAAANAGLTTGTIEGRVMKYDGTPMAGAKIELRSAAGVERAMSDNRGYFHFLSVYPDTYWLLITHPGYFMYWTNDFEVHAGQVTSCNARMDVLITGLYVHRRKGNRVAACT